MDTSPRSHTALVLKHARRYARSTGSTIPVEDIAKEAELLLEILEKAGQLREGDGIPVDAVLRDVVRHAAGRVKRQHTLITQIAAGDDLDAVSQDFAAIERDVPLIKGPPTAAQSESFRVLTRLKRGLPPADALVVALLYEDELPPDEVADVLVRTQPEIGLARQRILYTAKEQGITGEVERRAPVAGSVPPPDGTDGPLDRRIRAIANEAAGPSPDGNHVDEPLLRLMRDGDASDDIADAISHIAICPDCRASLTEGEVRRQSVVVLAIEAPREAMKDIERAAEGARARLVERGAGRWTALVDPERAASLRGELSKEDSSIVSRLVMTAPVEVAHHAPPVAGRRARAGSDLAMSKGTSAAEVRAWAQITRERKRRADSPHLGWTAFAIVVVLMAIALAIVLATR